jgi:flagellar assembly protein FliH
LLANSTKDNPISPCDAGALYYFPEIPCRPDNAQAAEPPSGQFVGGAHGPNEAQHTDKAQPQEREQIDSLIEAAYDKGLAQGRAETLAAHKDKLRQAVAALEAGAEALIRVRRQDVERMESETVRLALAIARKIIGREIENGGVIAQVVKSAMGKVADPRGVTLKVNPQDRDAVNSLKQAWLNSDDTGATLELEADESIQRGGCVIETRLGDVDARLDQQLRVIEELLEQQLPKPVAEG